MMPDLDKVTIDELKQGYSEENGVIRCFCCSEIFEEGRVYLLEGNYYTARKAAEVHHRLCHPDYFEQLLNLDIKYVSYTDNQKELLRLMKQGISDKESASQLGLSESTIRHQKFVFREKAKQAKMTLVLAMLAREGKTMEKDELLSLPVSARMVDERFVITEKEKEKVLTHSFLSLEPLVLKVFPAKAKRKIIVLYEIAKQFRSGIRYSEKEVNEKLKAIYADFVSLRRSFIEYGIMDRTDDGKEYWLKD